MNLTTETQIRVLHLDTGREWRGGQQQVLYLSRELVRPGHISMIMTPRGSPLAQRARGLDLPVREISYHGAGDPIAIRALVQSIQEIDASILHAHTANAHSLGFFALRLPGLPKDHKPAFVVHRRVDFPPGGDPLTRMRYTSDPCMFLCVSDAVRRVLEQHGVPADRLRVVRSCVDPARLDAVAGDDRSALRAELSISADAGLIGAVGSLVPHKGHRHLIAAMPRILAERPEAHIVIFGDGPLEAELAPGVLGTRTADAGDLRRLPQRRRPVPALRSTSSPTHPSRKGWGPRSWTRWRPASRRRVARGRDSRGRPPRRNGLARPPGIADRTGRSDDHAPRGWPSPSSIRRSRTGAGRSELLDRRPSATPCSTAYAEALTLQPRPPAAPASSGR